MNSQPTQPDGQQELAERRTDMAFHRTLLAEERTYSAWLRTGLASTATGFAIAKLLSEARPGWLVRSMAVIFILAGAAMFLLAFWAYRQALSKLDRIPTSGVPLWVLGAVSVALFVSAAASLLLIFQN